MPEHKKRSEYRKREYTHCSRGHEYTPENTAYYNRAGMYQPEKRCKTCNRENAKRYYDNKKAKR